jgi:hypothetical protein
MRAVYKTIFKFNLLSEETIMSETATPEVEVKREKVFIPAEMSIGEVQKKYSFTRAKSRRIKKKDFLSVTI